MNIDPDRPAALLSVSDKRGLAEFASRLAARGLTLLSTGGTAEALRAAGLDVVDVADYTGAAEMMGGRVKTLHPLVHGGILARRGSDEAVMGERGIVPIDWVVVNLYPFEATVARGDASLAECIENIDIGGPAMLRSAAKNHASVAVLTDPADYARAIESLDRDEPARVSLRAELAVKAFAHTARYDAAIAAHLGRELAATLDAEPLAAADRFPKRLELAYRRVDALRYGENPHQRAAFYRAATDAAEPQPDGTVGRARVLQGKALSYNNLVDADAALGCVQRFAQPACTIVKHANPCGVALGSDIGAAYDEAFRTDPTSAFGGIVAFNRALDAATATRILERQFVEVLIAPTVTPEASGALSAKPNVRVLECGTRTDARDAAAGTPLLKVISGGLLLQDDDAATVADDALRVVTRRAPSERERADLAFAWRVATFVKSNAIVFARDGATVGVGAGQMSRVYSARIAAIKAADAGLEVRGSVMASDAFFPFRDGLENAAEAGVRAVIQPGGSRNDADVIAAADEHDIAMLFTGMRHFRH